MNSTLAGYPGSQRGSLILSDYMNVDLSSCSPKRSSSNIASSSSASVAVDPLDSLPELCPCSDKDDGAEEGVKEENGVSGMYASLAAPVVPGLPAAAAVNKDDYTEMTFGGAGSPAKPISLHQSSANSDGGSSANTCTTSPSICVQRLTLGDVAAATATPTMGATTNCGGLEAFLLSGGSPPVSDPDRGAKVIRADPQGRRRHSSETFSSTTTVTPVFPSFAHHGARRHGASASVESVPASVRNSESGVEEGGSSNHHHSAYAHHAHHATSPMCRQTSAGFQNGLNYIALNLMDEGGHGLPASCDALVRFKATSCCKGGINGIHLASPYASLGFKETATAVKGELGCFILYFFLSFPPLLFTLFVVVPCVLQCNGE